MDISPVGTIAPLAAAKAPALIKFLACVIGDKIVLVICDIALGANTPYLYIAPILISI